MRTDNELLPEAKRQHLVEVKRITGWAAKVKRATGKYPTGINLMEASIALGAKSCTNQANKN